ncbi:hypothetical protein [Streptomyces swartbergensis]|uniref:hypothetical protein n=1 Tax=Streptomyces swartbergensis TaxID=487165 RepID=UPI003814D1BE
MDAELWAGNIERVLDEHPEGISQEELCSLTGLNPAQIELGVLWQDLMWHQRFGRRGGGEDQDLPRDTSHALSLSSTTPYAGPGDDLSPGAGTHPEMSQPLVQVALFTTPDSTYHVRHGAWPPKVSVYALFGEPVVRCWRAAAGSNWTGRRMITRAGGRQARIPDGSCAVRGYCAARGTARPAAPFSQRGSHTVPVRRVRRPERSFTNARSGFRSHPQSMTRRTSRRPGAVGADDCDRMSEG